MEELEEALERYGSKNVAERLNLAPGTVKRWVELGNVPGQYFFDLLKMIDRPIDYANFSPKDKDQFFTPPDLVRTCWSAFRLVVPDDLEQYQFIEPSAERWQFSQGPSSRNDRIRYRTAPRGRDPSGLFDVDRTTRALHRVR